MKSLKLKTVDVIKILLLMTTSFQVTSCKQKEKETEKCNICGQWESKYFEQGNATLDVQYKVNESDKDNKSNLKIIGVLISNNSYIFNEVKDFNESLFSKTNELRFKSSNKSDTSFLLKQISNNIIEVSIEIYKQVELVKKEGTLPKGELSDAEDAEDPDNLSNPKNKKYVTIAKAFFVRH